MDLQVVQDKIKQADIKHRFYYSDNLHCYARDYGYIVISGLLYVICYPICESLRSVGPRNKNVTDFQLKAMCIDYHEEVSVKFRIEGVSASSLYDIQNINEVPLDGVEIKVSKVQS